MKRLWNQCIAAWSGSRSLPLPYRHGDRPTALCLGQSSGLGTVYYRIALAGVLLLPHTLANWVEHFSGVDGALSGGHFRFFSMLIVALFISVLVETVFAAGRRLRVLDGWFVPAWLFMLVVPADVGWMQLVFALALGLLVGRLLFGGPGKQIVSPALLALLFLYTAYPSAFDSSGSGPSPWVKWGGLPDGGTAWWPLLIGSDGALSAVSSPAACVLAGAFLVLIGVVSWRTLTGGLLGLVLASAVISWVGPPGPLTSTPWYIHAVSGGFAFGLVFLAADPDSAPLTPGGRWMLGLLTGVLTVLIRLADPSHPDGVLHAILLAALFAPLADEWFVRRALRLRRLREEAWP